jgi:2-hydroxychromene-2-carboxylate isomerase
VAAGRRRAVLGELAGRVTATRRSFLLLPGVGQRPAYDEYVIRHRVAAAQQAPELGFAIPTVGQPYPASSLPAQRVALHVQDRAPERLDGLEDALFRAMFVELADVARPEVLRACARAAGVPGEAVDHALADETLVQRALAEHEQARALGVGGSFINSLKKAMLVRPKAFFGSGAWATCRH